MRLNADGNETQAHAKTRHLSLSERHGARRLEPLVGQGRLCFWHRCRRRA